MATSEDDIEETVEVLVRGIKEGKVTTIMQFLSPMIIGASSLYETLYKVKEGDSIKIIFKFSASPEDTSQGEGAKELEGEVSVVCRHEHPFLDKKVWLATKGRMESTYLKGNLDLL
jgi:hypothetical protein